MSKYLELQDRLTKLRKCDKVDTEEVSKIERMLKRADAYLEHEGEVFSSISEGIPIKIAYPD